MRFSLLLILANVLLARRVMEAKYPFPLARRAGAMRGATFGGMCAVLLSLTGPLDLLE